MPLKFFSVPATLPGDAESELNRFLRGHRVVSIERQFALVGGAAVWCLAVEYLDSALPIASGAAGDPGMRKNRIDYKDVLPPADFARFSKLRELRKQLAEEDGLPVFAVFTNEQLAAIAQKCPRTAIDLQSVEGIGDGKGGRYGARVLALLSELLPAEPQTE